MKANLIKETEKAVCLTYVCEIYGEDFTCKKVWFPKSQIEIIGIENGVVEFEPKNDWILDVKTKDYCKFVNETFGTVKSEIKTYLSRINCEKVTFCWS